ncbi:hypothetical protein SAM23877_1549 [Streptomyces ambofaciens ATCC 23877]|uniref:Uncharacterized protein n=1 Tax=Streptomyces ambofaciens (strain ATCC 23877 / 3486 / DSM 40053 / JCM 4204 / NBRC 12836 / NRRL B-2516) TaxID=278992 RepID=A0A0K2ANM9_STRA7|nr:hypothetical protein SAM23877_1549 [Streptomyces ambofaciens ATCC 23877]
MSGKRTDSGPYLRTWEDRQWRTGAAHPVGPLPHAEQTRAQGIPGREH